MKRVVIVSGACGVGKSESLRSMREVLEDRVGEVAVLESDHFYMMIDPHWLLPSDRAERYFEVAGWLLRETARGFLRAGFDWVAIASNGLWDEAHVREFVAPLVSDGARVHHVTLDPGLDAVCERLGCREAMKGSAVDSKKTQASSAVELLRLRERYGAWTHVLDNSTLTPAETALAIFDVVEAGAGILC